MPFNKAFDILKNKKIAQAPIQAAWVCHIAQTEIDESFPEKDICIGSYRNKTLNIKVGNSVLAGEVRMKSLELKNKINEKLRKELIENIRTKIS
jgi:hypothetical protein